MQFQNEDLGDVFVVIPPTMDLDAGNADEFKKSATPIVEGHPKVIMDMTNIGFMDSAGLGAILSVFKRVRADGGHFCVFGLSEDVKALFDLVRMQRLIEVYDDKDSALRASSG